MRKNQKDRDLLFICVEMQVLLFFFSLKNCKI